MKKKSNPVKNKPKKSTRSRAVENRHHELLYLIYNGETQEIRDKARNEFIEMNMPLVYSIAKKYLNRGLEYEDLVQEGFLGLSDTIERFDVSKGWQFSTYATWWIRRSIEDSLHKSGGIKRPHNFYESIKLLHKSREEYKMEHGRYPTKSELSSLTGVTLDRVQNLLRVLSGVASLDNHIGGDSENGSESSSLLDMIVDTDENDPEHHCVDLALKEYVEKALSFLNDKEREIINLRFGFDGGNVKSLREVAALMSLSPERVRQIEKIAMIKLRFNNNVCELLKEYYPRRIFFGV